MCCRIYFDDDLVMETVPPAGGFWEMGNSEWGLPDDQNPWQKASRMAPFDQEVSFAAFSAPHHLESPQEVSRRLCLLPFIPSIIF